MKKLLLLLVLVFICVVGYKAYNASQTNGKSIPYNIAKSTKDVAGKIAEEGKETAEDINEGLK